MGRDRPDPKATEAENENRKSYGQMWLAKQVLRYHLENVATIQSGIAESIVFQKANVGPIVFRGSWPWPAFPPLPSAPDVDPRSWESSRIRHAATSSPASSTRAPGRKGP